MKLYVFDPITNEKIHLKQNAKTRDELAENIGAYSFKVNEIVFSVNDVLAEPSDNTAGAMAAGGVIGAAGGVPGVIIGGAIGFLLGKGSDDDDKINAEAFNRSRS